MPVPERDAWVDRLARLFLEHPAWQDAARRLSQDTTSDVYFTHRPGEAWHLERGDGRSLLLAGAADDPDFVFRFSPAAIERLESVSGSVGEFAVALFSMMAGEDSEARVDCRIAAGFPRLLRRGFVKLLLVSGPGVLAFGARHGVFTVGALRRVVSRLSSTAPEPWERGG